MPAVEPAPGEGIANCPFDNFAFKIAKAVGVIKAELTPKAEANPAAVRFESVKLTGKTGNIKLLVKDAPLRSRVP